MYDANRIEQLNVLYRFGSQIGGKRCLCAAMPCSCCLLCRTALNSVSCGVATQTAATKPNEFSFYACTVLTQWLLQWLRADFGRDPFNAFLFAMGQTESGRQAKTTESKAEIYKCMNESHFGSHNVICLSNEARLCVSVYADGSTHYMYTESCLEHHNYALATRIEWSKKSSQDDLMK